MKTFIVSFLLISILSCSNSIMKNCDVEPYNQNEIKELRKSFGIKSDLQFRKHDMSKLTAKEFIRYLASVEAFNNLGELYSKGYNNRTLIIPYMLPPFTDKSLNRDNDLEELFKLICSKQPAIPTMNSNAASFPDKLSTVGIEAMHLIHYLEGNEATYVSNREFCIVEKQDSLVKVFNEKYN